MNHSIITIQEQIDCVVREIKYRAWVYRKRINDGKMTKEDAIKEYETMKAVLETLKIAAGGEVGAVIQVLSELDNDSVDAKKSLVVVMQENARLIAESQNKDNIIKQKDEFIKSKDSIINIQSKFITPELNETIEILLSKDDEQIKNLLTKHKEVSK